VCATCLHLKLISDDFLHHLRTSFFCLPFSSFLIVGSLRRRCPPVTHRLNTTSDHGQTKQQAPSWRHAGPDGEHGLHRARDHGVVQGLLAGLPQRRALHGRVQEDLRQLLPLRRRLQVRRARLPHLRRQRRRDDRLQGVHHRPERDVSRSAGPEAEVGVQYVRPGWQWIHQQGGDAGDRVGEWTVAVSTDLGPSVFICLRPVFSRLCAKFHVALSRPVAAACRHGYAMFRGPKVNYFCREATFCSAVHTAAAASYIRLLPCSAPFDCPLQESQPLCKFRNQQFLSGPQTSLNKTWLVYFQKGAVLLWSSYWLCTASSSCAVLGRAVPPPPKCSQQPQCCFTTNSLTHAPRLLG